MSPVAFTEGELVWSVPSLDKPCKTWYTIAGKLEGRTHRPLVVINGGPSASHDYLLPIAALASSYSIPVIFYDQIGSARSTQLLEKKGDETFWTETLFLDELDALLAHLGVKQDYDLLGHSWWGGILSARHATRNPVGLKKLIISNSPASMPLLLASFSKLRAGLPKEAQDTLAKHEADGTLNDPAYRTAFQAFFENHVCKVKSTPEQIVKSRGLYEQNKTAFSVMHGPSELVVTGTLKQWTVIDDIHKITANTLLINGHFDLAQDFAVQPFFDRLNKVKWVQFAESSHAPHHEETERYISVVGNFLKLA